MTDAAKTEVALCRAPSFGVVPGRALRDAGITFPIALALFGPLVGLRTDTVNNVPITTHFGKALALSGVIAGASASLSTFSFGGGLPMARPSHPWRQRPFRSCASPQDWALSLASSSTSFPRCAPI